ncbi:MAG: Gfo/Idh/MocA family oxidoreductase [Propionibacteriaceae bacterium]|jgi:predicted dehydrogenase|nr:Gfo/Idh/MocA family oxidoreductase [Propionibacteriaceae bacterium]
MAARKLGVGLISAGWMGRLHTRAYLALPDKYSDIGVEPELVVVCDTVEANAASFVERYGYRRATADYREVLDDPDVDVVSICSPNFLHRDFAVAAAAAGKHFWIEKPMGVSRQQSLEIVEAAQAAGVFTGVGFTYRGSPAVERARQLIDEGAIGRVTNVHCHLDADYSADPRAPHTWRYERERAGTGVLGDLLSHGFDLAQYLVRSAVDQVSAITSTFIPQRPQAGQGVGHSAAVADDAPLLPVENEDYAAVLARFANGVVGTFETSRACLGSRCDYGIDVHGTEGAIRWNFERVNELEVCSGPRARDYGYTRLMSDSRFGDFGRFQQGAGMGLSFDDLKVIEGSRFARSVLEGRQVAPSVADGLAAASAAAACDESARSGAWVAVPAPVGVTTFDA